MILTCSVGTFPLTGEPNPFASINSVLKINFYPLQVSVEENTVPNYNTS